MELAERITKAELEVMKVLWRAGEPVGFTRIREELQKEKGWEKSTINTLIRRLVDKGVLTAERGEATLYIPNVTEAAYREAEERELIDRLYQGSAKGLVAALCHRGELTEADLDELKAYFRAGGNHGGE